jgi:hypothetical protein
MLQTKWVIFFIMAFMLCSIFSGFIEQSYLGANGQSSVLTPLTNMWSTSSSSAIGKVVALAVSPVLYNTFWHMFCWDYAMYTGIYAIVKIPLFCISAGFAYSLLITLLGVVGPLLSAGVNAIASLFHY